MPFLSGENNKLGNSNELRRSLLFEEAIIIISSIYKVSSLQVLGAHFQFVKSCFHGLVFFIFK